MRIGITIAPAASFDAMIKQAVDAERDGFEAASFNSGIAGEPLVSIAVVGRETSTIELATGIAVTYTRHPYLMAQAALTANAACNGRLVLGIGPSHRPTIERLGLSYEGAAAHTREYVSVLKPLIEGKQVEFRGEFFKVESQIALAWGRPCPVLIAALAPRMLQTAGELADGTVTWMVGAKALREHIVPRIKEAASIAGRPAPRISVGLPVAVTDNVEEGKRRAATAFANYGNLPNYRRVLDLEGAEVADVALIGNEAEVERRLRELAAAGASDFTASPFSVGENGAASHQRTRELLTGLVGKF